MAGKTPVKVRQDQRRGRRSGSANRPVPPGKTTRQALAVRRPWRPERPAKGAADLNDLAPEWKTLKADPLADRTFKNVANRNTAIAEAIEAMNQNRQPCSLANQSA